MLMTGEIYYEVQLWKMRGAKDDLVSKASRPPSQSSHDL